MGLVIAPKALLDRGNVISSVRPRPLIRSRLPLSIQGSRAIPSRPRSVGYIYAKSTTGQAALYQLGLPGIPITNLNNNSSTGSTALEHAAALVCADDAGSASNVRPPAHSTPSPHFPTALARALA